MPKTTNIFKKIVDINIERLAVTELRIFAINKLQFEAPSDKNIAGKHH